MLNSLKIRQEFLEYFRKNGHQIVASDSLVPSGDPTLLFSSAGMVQFKKHFLGQSADTFKRAASCQKCFRTSDIERVGNTSRHLTFFEMLGNFSFGDYFKQDAIAWGWEFLTGEMALPKDKLYPTIFKEDDEAYNLWKKIVPESRIIRLGEDSNFWNMGPTGPCGPCSEILIDLGEELGCGNPNCAPGCDFDRYLEIWNLVFTQFDRQQDGSLKNLPRKNIDTGMGLERVTAAATGKKSIFDTDLFTPSIQMLADILDLEKAKHTPALRMMADHCRAVTFLVSDGILPSNEGRGYVLRRILRRALRKGRMLGAREPFLFKVSAALADSMKDAYPELEQRRENIASIAKLEEEKFLETLESGMKILDDLLKKTGSGKVLDGGEAFKLYDTYGFPFDLTKEIAQEQGYTVDENSYLASQKEAQNKSRAAWSGSGEKDTTFFAALSKEAGRTVFEGYSKTNASSRIKAIAKQALKTDVISAGEEGSIILEVTPFYAESGGQVGDTGVISSAEGTAEVINTIKPVEGLFVHQVKVTKGSFRTGESVEARVDIERRKSIMRHHTATHLLHKALRSILGAHIAQAGSLVSPDYFRFDFTHPSGLKNDELKACEEIVNKAIRDNMPVCITSMSLAEARKAGAMALFGEKYGETVRAVTVSEASIEQPFSMELCGGTHVSRTGDIGFFKITSESSVAAGTRRIEAVAGRQAEIFVHGLENTLEDISKQLKVSSAEISSRIDKLLSDQKAMEKELSAFKSKLASGGAADLVKNARDINGIKVVSSKVSGMDLDTLKDFSDKLKNSLGSGIVLIANDSSGKVSFVTSVTDDKVKAGYSAGKIAKSFAALIKGSGGGKPEFAQGGGKDPALLDSALSKIEEVIKGQPS